MTADGDRPPAGCATPGCPRDGSFWWFDRDDGGWSPVCDVHARHLHPSLEVHAWLESGYLRPIELGRPDGPPPEPSAARGRAFRAAVEAAMGWTE